MHFLLPNIVFFTYAEPVIEPVSRLVLHQIPLAAVIINNDLYIHSINTQLIRYYRFIYISVGIVLNWKSILPQTLFLPWWQQGVLVSSSSFGVKKPIQITFSLLSSLLLLQLQTTD